MTVTVHLFIDCTKVEIKYLSDAHSSLYHTELPNVVKLQINKADAHEKQDNEVSSTMTFDSFTFNFSKNSDKNKAFF